MHWHAALVLAGGDSNSELGGGQETCKDTRLKGLKATGVEQI